MSYNCSSTESDADSSYPSSNALFDGLMICYSVASMYVYAIHQGRSSTSPLLQFLRHKHCTSICLLPFKSIRPNVDQMVSWICNVRQTLFLVFTCEAERRHSGFDTVHTVVFLQQMVFYLNYPKQLWW